jgi:hypothetical protein
MPGANSCARLLVLIATSLAREDVTATRKLRRSWRRWKRCDENKTDCESDHADEHDTILQALGESVIHVSHPYLFSDR